ARAFMSDNYVAVGRLRVAGQLFGLDTSGLGKFTIAIPGRYAILTPDGTAAGELDGSPLDGGRMLEAGPHVFRPAPPPTIYAVLWADAVDSGYSPFHPRLGDVE